MNIELAKIAIDKMAFFIPEDVLNDLYKDHDATAEILAQDENRVVFSIVYHDKKDKRILSITVKRNEINVHYNGTMSVFSHRIDELFYNDVLSVLFNTQDVQPVEINQVKEKVMKTEIDLLSLCGTLGFEAIQKMFDSHMINRDQLNHVSYMWKQANKETYKIIVKSFNDGNNEFEEIVYINPNNMLDIVYQHTQGGETTIEQVLKSKDKFIADKMLSALNTVLNLRLQFNMKCTDIKCAIMILNNNV